MYSFSENSGGKLPEQEALVFQFLMQKWLILIMLYLWSFKYLKSKTPHYYIMISILSNPIG